MIKIYKIKKYKTRVSHVINLLVRASHLVKFDPKLYAGKVGEGDGPRVTWVLKFMVPLIKLQA